MCLLDFYKMMLYFCETRNEWKDMTKDINGVLENLSGETKGRKYVQKVIHRWRCLEGEEEGITKEDKVLLARLKH